jgi:membrane-associated protease RseP (regulator of RpoE activity)
MALNINLLSAIIFYSIIILVIFLNRKKFQIYAKVIALYRTKLGIKTIERIANISPAFWKVVGYIGIYVGFLGLILIFAYLIQSLYTLITNPAAPAALALVIPGVKIPGSPIFVPFWYGIISLFIVILIHEVSHGIIANAYKIKIKNTGVGMMAMFPLAFVEPDEKVIQKRPAKQQLSIFAAGPFSNIILAVVALLIGSFVVLPIAMSNVNVSGVEIANFEKGFPAETSGLQSGDIITFVNGVPVTEVSNFTSEMDKLSVGDSVEIVTANGTYTIPSKANPVNATKPYIGVYVSQHIDLKPEVSAKYGNFAPWLWFYLLRFLQWLMVLSLGIGLANLLPLGPVDGGRMLLTGLSKVFKKNNTAVSVWKYISYLCLFLLVLNLIYPYLRMLF